MTIGDFLRTNQSAINFFRLVLAAGVVIDHSYVVGEFGHSPCFHYLVINSH